MNKQICSISNEKIQHSLENNTRQYLVGKLSLPQVLNHIEDDKLEIGITSYADFHSESPHYHTQAYEYQYIVKGSTEYMDVETGQEYTFHQGDFYVTPPGIKYAQRSQPGTEILFIKTPPGNDKQIIEATNEVKEWLKGK
ncbi:cupin domain-containing protein [Priestia megaterium]|uniref:cupin domain-containing protein n=1 Tax=Priestia megaterium TaxID=1404 RepID=UPI0012D8ABF7|nr:cupin domain-containing protein [Priestia megaterium]MCT9852031.1 cupin domain-containing protein [Priestia megaterium]MDF1962938.1 cupin domain-containing protein [Priestia megaterium]MUL33999.1 Cupin domain protein [Priestia megaterium]